MVRELASVRMLNSSIAVWILSAISTGFVIAADSALAQQPFAAINADSLNTPAGPLTVSKGAKPICDLDNCSVIRLGSAILAKNWSAGLVGAYPSKEAPVFVSYYTHGGGNCCLPGVELVDVVTTPFFEFGGLFLQSNLPGPFVKELGNGVFEISGDNYERNKLGDRIPTTYVYDRKRKLVWEKPDQDTPKPSMISDRDAPGLAEFIGKYPHDFLAHPKSREPLVSLVGEDSFKSFRDHIGVAAPMTLVNRRWLTGHGCLPHSCGANEGYFAIDLRTGKLVAAQFDKDIVGRGQTRIYFWTDIDPTLGADAYALRSSIDEWLKAAGAKLLPGPALRIANPSNANVQSGTLLPSPVTPERNHATSAAAEASEASASIGPSFDCGVVPLLVV